MARPSKENAADWEAIERAYRLGNKTISQLADEYGVNKSSISRRAKSSGWIQDKTEEVQTIASALLTQSLCVNATQNATSNATPSAFDVQIAAQTQANVVLGHRKGLAKLSGLRDRLLDDIEGAIDLLGSHKDILSALSDGDGEALVSRVSKVLGRSVIIDDLKKLAEIDEKVRKGEREAFGIKEEGEKTASYEQMLERLAGLSLPGAD